MKLAGKTLADIFEPDAIAAIHAKLTLPARSQQEVAISRAYPLTVNNYMTLLLNEAAALGAARINQAIVREV
ncbi:MAG: hypothetical protein JNM11_12580 [Chitinimonas sp.]|nr:hypothetical protein [Chitinimonas sp.]